MPRFFFALESSSYLFGFPSLSSCLLFFFPLGKSARLFESSDNHRSPGRHFLSDHFESLDMCYIKPHYIDQTGFIDLNGKKRERKRRGCIRGSIWIRKDLLFLEDICSYSYNAGDSKSLQDVLLLRYSWRSLPNMGEHPFGSSSCFF